MKELIGPFSQIITMANLPERGAISDNSLEIIEDGGWHFTNIRKAEDLEKKLLGFLHHVDYEDNPIDEENIDNLVSERIAIYDHEKDNCKLNFKMSYVKLNRDINDFYKRA